MESLTWLPYLSKFIRHIWRGNGIVQVVFCGYLLDFFAFIRHI